MRTVPIAVAALSLLGAAASAQTPSTTHTSPMTPPKAATAPAPAANPLNQADLSKIEGASVYGNDNGKIGHVSTVLMDPATKKISRFVVATGGVLGLGSHDVALPIDQFTWDSALSGFRISQTEAALKNMPAWVAGHTATATGSSEAPGATAQPSSAGDSKPAH